MLDSSIFSSLDAWEIAALIGCDYTGDCNPIDHDGTFYDARDWEKYGYASCVRFTRLEDDCLLVECATINRPADMSKALDCYGCSGEDRTISGVQIEACLAYNGAEVDEDFSGRFAQEFLADDDGNIDESAVWADVVGWLANLGE